MSYILDALRRADSERERGSVPGIHAQPVPVSASDDASGPAIRPWMWGVAAAAMVLLGWYEWQDLKRSSVPLAALPEASMAAPVPAPAPAPSPVALPAPTVTARVAPAAALPVPTTNVSLPAVPRPSATAKPRDNAPAAETSAAAPVARPAASAAESRIYALSELPDTIQRELPKLSVGGSIYSDNAASRFLIINGQVFHENDKVGPELVLEQIKLKAAVLRFKGYRYGISY